MSLKVWLPLNGNLYNQGCSNVTVTNNGATVNANGKIGSCYHFGTASQYMNISKEAMNTFTTECSIAFWLKIKSWNTSYATFFQAGLGSTAWTHYIFGFLRNNANSTVCFTISNGSSASNASYLTSSLSLDTWYHVVLTYTTGKCTIYLNGTLDHEYTTSIVPNFAGITTITLGKCNNGSSYQTDCDINDFRIYDHYLSAAEIKEISQGLVLHYKLDSFQGGYGNPNLITNFDTSFLSYADGATTLFTNQMNSGTQEIISNFAGASKCLHLHSNGGSNRQYKTFSATSGKTYTVSVDYYSTTTQSLAFKGELYGGNYSWTEMRAGAYDTPGAWKRISFTYSNLTSNATLFMFVCCANGTDCYVKNFKIEEGTSATNWVPNGVTSTIIQDSSGYGHNGILNDTTAKISSDTARYSTALLTSQANNSATYPIKGECNIPESSNLTFAWWMKPTTIGIQTSGIFSTSNSDATDYSTTAANMRDSCFDCCNTSGTCKRINVASYLTTNEWHHYALTYNGAELNFYKDGVSKVTLAQTGALKAFKYIFPFYSKAGGVNRTTSGGLSDFRIYVTTLSAADVLSLYNTAAKVDNLGGLHTFELNENGSNKLTKTGIFKDYIVEPFMTLSDGSKWQLLLYHQVNNGTNLFTSSNAGFNNGFGLYSRLNYIDNFTYDSKYEFYVIQDGVVYRWTQTNAPLTTTSVTGFTAVTGSPGSGICKCNGNTLLAKTGTTSNWWNACGCWTIYNGGIPGFGSSVVCKKHLILYARISEPKFKIANLSVYANNLIER